jgi:hypothetical protein
MHVPNFNFKTACPNGPRSGSARPLTATGTSLPTPAGVLVLLATWTPPCSEEEESRSDPFGRVQLIFSLVLTVGYMRFIHCLDRLPVSFVPA